MKRRALLSTVGLTAAATAGCLDTVVDDAPIRLARFATVNHTSDPVRIDLRVDRDGETVHESFHQLREKEDGQIHGAVVDCDWGTTPGEYVVFARVADTEWTSKPVSDVRDESDDSVECATAVAHYEDGVWLQVRDDCERYTRTASSRVCSDEFTVEE